MPQKKFFHPCDPLQTNWFTIGFFSTQHLEKIIQQSAGVYFMYCFEKNCKHVILCLKPIFLKNVALCRILWHNSSRRKFLTRRLPKWNKYSWYFGEFFTVLFIRPSVRRQIVCMYYQLCSSILKRHLMGGKVLLLSDKPFSTLAHTIYNTTVMPPSTIFNMK